MATFHISPAESLLSGPDTMSTLFNNTHQHPSPPSSDRSSLPNTMHSTPPPSSGTLNPMDIMTPQSYSDEARSSPTPTTASIKSEDVSSPSPDDKKTTKKRKSWGQVLPEPKTNLPPRKRAKTEDEKEQRRVERVLRNRRAAQSSRERKRLEVEALEERNKALEAALQDASKANKMLMDAISELQKGSGISTVSTNITLSQQLFTSNQEAVEALKESSASTLDPISDLTVDPSSLSPALSPVAEDETMEPSKAANSEDLSINSISNSDVAQHPAAMLSDLQCPSEEIALTEFSPAVSQASTQPPLAWLLLLKMMWLSASATLSTCQRPMTQIALSLKAGFSLHPNPQLLTKIIWLVTLPRELRNNLLISMTSSSRRHPIPPVTSSRQRATTSPRTMDSTRGSLTLRLKFLRKILSSSPTLARPLMDATIVAMRLVGSKEQDNQVGTSPAELIVTRECDRELAECLKQIALPSKEVLMTLLWALKIEQKRIQRKNQNTNTRLRPETSVPKQQPLSNNTIQEKKKNDREGGTLNITGPKWFAQ